MKLVCDFEGQDRHTRPGRAFHNWTVGVFQDNEWNFDGNRRFTDGGMWWEATLRNFWRPSARLRGVLRALSDDQTRGGPLMQTAANWSLDLGLASRSGARTGWGVEATVARNELDGHVFETEASLSARPGTRWELSLESRYRRELAARQYVTTTAGGPPATFGERYIFAYLERNDVVIRLRTGYAVTPSFTVEAYVEPFASSGRYRDFGELAVPRRFDLRTYGAAGTTITRNGDTTYTVVDGASQFEFDVPDFDVRSLRSNLVLRWEWQPGSTLFLVWQQDRFRNGIPRKDVGVNGLWDAFRIAGDHFLALKVSYWIAAR